MVGEEKETHRQAWASRVLLVEDNIAYPSVAADTCASVRAHHPPADTDPP